MTAVENAREESLADASPKSAANRFDDLGRVILKAGTIITACIAAAVPATEYIRGYSNQKISEAERNSKLASEFLDKIAAKEASGPDRLMYLSALTSLKDHPLQSWAEKQHDAQMKDIDGLKAILLRAQPALEASSVAQANVRALETQIESVVLKIKNGNSAPEVEKRGAELAELNRKMLLARTAATEEQQKVAEVVAESSRRDRPSSELFGSIQKTTMEVRARLEQLTREEEKAKEEVEAIAQGKGTLKGVTLSDANSNYTAARAARINEEAKLVALSRAPQKWPGGNTMPPIQQ